MSPDNDPPQGPPEPPRVDPDEPTAQTKSSRWPGWIWGVPIAAVLIVGYLAFKQIIEAGPTVTVIFPAAEGIQAGQTSVMYHGLKVGQVESARLEKDMQHVRTRLSLSAQLDGHLGPGTLFWISGVSLSNLASISSLISGPSIGMQPAPGKPQKEYQGLTKPPVVKETKPGEQFLLHAAKLGNIGAGSKVVFEGMEVGKVEQAILKPDRKFAITVFVQKPYDRFVHTGTRFWNAGAVQVSMQGAGPHLQMQSLSALLAGAIAFETPTGAAEGPPAPAQHEFTLYESRAAAEYSPGRNAVLYRVVFDAKAGTLAAHAPVKLVGTQVGSVKSAQLIYDPQSGQLQESAVIAIDPDRITLPTGKSWPVGQRGPVDAFMRSLIKQGLRARAESSIPVVGAEDVSLEFVQGAKPATLIAGSPPEIPSAPGGGGIGGIVTAVNGVANKLDRIAAKLNGIPLDRIGKNIQTITGRLAALSKSPELQESLDNLDASLANVKQVTSVAKADLPAVIHALRGVATNANKTIAEARQLISTTAGNGPVGLNQAGLGQTLYQLSRAAEAVRQLADYLDRHPSALIRGRG